MSCAECQYLQTERAGMLMSDRVPVATADRLASKERCREHRNETVEEEMRGWEFRKRARELATGKAA